MQQRAKTNFRISEPVHTKARHLNSSIQSGQDRLCPLRSKIGTKTSSYRTPFEMWFARKPPVPNTPVFMVCRRRQQRFGSVKAIHWCQPDTLCFDDDDDDDVDGDGDEDDDAQDADDDEDDNDDSDDFDDFDDDDDAD